MDLIDRFGCKKVNRSSEIKGISRTDFKTIRDKVFFFDASPQLVVRDQRGLKGKIPYPGFLDRLDELDY